MDLDALRVLVVDCQASGATPAHGNLLELGWSITTGAASEPVRSAWTKTERAVSRIVRKLTGWDERASAEAIASTDAWSRLLEDASTLRAASGPAPTVIHFARFELGFLRHLHAAADANARFPLEVVCLHAVAQRLFPNLPRRNLRALAGHLGGAPEVLRRAGPHVVATGVVWRAVLPRLAAEGITTWDALQDWLAVPSSRPRAIVREFPLAAARRKALPDVPGVYRFLRPNGDVLYVGKAASIRKRIASHYTTNKGSRATERALEMLSQVHDVEFTHTPTALEAALVEVDEIKRLDPPYNVHLRAADRSAWFATRDWSRTAPAMDDAHVLGPLPSRTAVSGIAAMRTLLRGAPIDVERASAAVGVGPAFGPPLDLFAAEWSAFAAAELAGDLPTARRILAAAQRLVVQESPDAEDAPPEWDGATVRRYLERVVVTEGALLRRARLLALLSHAHVRFREPNGVERTLSIANGIIAATQNPIDEAETHPWAAEPPPPRRARIAAFDASRYDRLRVLATELRRVTKEGGAAEVRVGRHVVPL